MTYTTTIVATFLDTTTNTFTVSGPIPFGSDPAAIQGLLMYNLMFDGTDYYSPNGVKKYTVTSLDVPS
jgi:hypothetical protein